MSVKVVLFDLDATLLPMDQDAFVTAYFETLTKKLVSCGYDRKVAMDAVWNGVVDMMKDDGQRTNEEAFWNRFESIYGKISQKDLLVFDEFYDNDFDSIRELCGFDPSASKVVRELKNKGYRVVLATNPVFPFVATKKRIEWAGLSACDFEYITTYENSTYSKPHVNYYTEILKAIGADASECLMVGNDTRDDMVAESLGMKVFLATKCLINKENKDISVYPRGDLEDLVEFIKTI